jgi:hypothetical protein
MFNYKKVKNRVTVMIVACCFLVVPSESVRTNLTRKLYDSADWFTDESRELKFEKNSSLARATRHVLIILVETSRQSD